jgi:hypothetical protein
MKRLPLNNLFHNMLSGVRNVIAVRESNISMRLPARHRQKEGGGVTPAALLKLDQHHQVQRGSPSLFAGASAVEPT